MYTSATAGNSHNAALIYLLHLPLFLITINVHRVQMFKIEGMGIGYGLPSHSSIIFSSSETIKNNQIQTNTILSDCRLY